MAISTPSIQTIKNAYLLAELRKAAKKEHNDENYGFYFDKSNNQTVYTKWISPKSSTQVNLPASIQKELDALAAAKKWSGMSAGIKKARDEIARLINNDMIARFAGTDDGEFIIAAAAMGVTDAGKAAQIKNFLTVYLKPRSPGDQYAAYLAMQKLAAKAKLDPVLKDLGVPAPTKPVSDEAVVAKNMKVDKLAKQLAVDIAAALKYYESALKFLKEKGKPADQEEVGRMFESGRMRHDKVHEPYGEAIRLDKAFATKYPKVAADQKKVSEAWAAYRRALGR
jgi:hypothetical protein